MMNRINLQLVTMGQRQRGASLDIGPELYHLHQFDLGHIDILICLCYLQA